MSKSDSYLWWHKSTHNFPRINDFVRQENDFQNHRYSATRPSLECNYMITTNTYISMPQLLFCRTDDFHVFLCNSRMWNTRNASIRIFHTGEISKIYWFRKPRKFTFISTGTFLLPGDNSFLKFGFVFGNKFSNWNQFCYKHFVDSTTQSAYNLEI